MPSANSTQLHHFTPEAALSGTGSDACMVVLHYHPRSVELRGCSAVSQQHGGHSICMEEAAAFVYKAGAEVGRPPVRWVVSAAADVLY